MIGVLWILFFLFLTLRNRELGVIATALMSPALTCLRWGFMDVYAILCFMYILLYCNKIFSFLTKPFPFKSVLVVFLLSKFFSTFFASEHHPYVFLMCILDAFFIVVFIIAVSDIRNTMSIRSFVYIMTVMVAGYGLFTFITNFNPYIDETIREGINSVEGQIMMRFGRLRIQSIFAYIETLGGFCVMMISLACILYKASETIPKLKKQSIVMLALLSLTCFLTSSRSQIVGMVIVLMQLPLIVKSKSKYITFPLIALLIIIFASGYIGDIISSFSDTNSVSGSNANMREEQLASSLYFMLTANNVFIGNGLGFCDSQVIGLDSGIVGAESIWFRIMIDQGYLGVFSFVFLVLYSMVISYKIYKPFIFIPVAYLAIRTLAVVPDMSETYIIFILILAMRFVGLPPKKHKWNYLSKVENYA